jgi:hypothetical protein
LEGHLVADFLSELAARVGIDPGQAQQAFGAVLNFLKSKLPADAFAKVESAVPDAHGAMSAAESVPESSGGMLGAAMEKLGGLFGGKGGDAAVLTGQLAKIGLSADQLKAFLPKVLEFLSSRLPPEVVEKIRSHIPGLGGQASETPH